MSVFDGNLWRRMHALLAIACCKVMHFLLLVAPLQ